MNKKAFSFVEMIIAVAIIVLLASIGISYKSSYDDNKFNAKVQADLASLNNAFLSYKQENNSLPDSKSNKNFFKIDSSYAHDENDDAFGVHGFVTDDLIPKKYIDSLPLDPRTNQFYAYGKTLSPKKLQFEFAGVVKNDGIYQTIVSGNYDGKELVGLIREYNGPQFLYNKSTQNFPYNPEERLMTAKIGSFSGSVEIIKNGNTINSNILNQVLVKGDTIKVNGDGFANIYYSDGSRSTLESKSSITLDDMKYKSNNNLLTKVKLLLSQGSIWTKATSLNPDGSEFEITNSDATAAVRGTIFKTEKQSTFTKIIVKKGKVELFNDSAKKLLTAGDTFKATSYSINKDTLLTDSPFYDKEIIFPSNIKPEILSVTPGKEIVIKQARKGFYIKDNSGNKGYCDDNGKCSINKCKLKDKNVELCVAIGEGKESCAKVKINTNVVYKQEKNKIKQCIDPIFDPNGQKYCLYAKTDFSEENANLFGISNGKTFTPTPPPISIPTPIGGTIYLSGTSLTYDFSDPLENYAISIDTEFDTPSGTQILLKINTNKLHFYINKTTTTNNLMLKYTPTPPSNSYYSNIFTGTLNLFKDGTNAYAIVIDKDNDKKYELKLTNLDKANTKLETLQISNSASSWKKEISSIKIYKKSED